MNENITLVETWKIDCKEVRLDLGKLIRRLW